MSDDVERVAEAMNEHIVIKAEVIAPYRIRRTCRCGKSWVYASDRDVSQHKAEAAIAAMQEVGSVTIATSTEGFLADLAITGNAFTLAKELPGQSTTSVMDGPRVDSVILELATDALCKAREGWGGVLGSDDRDVYREEAVAVMGAIANGIQLGQSDHGIAARQIGVGVAWVVALLTGELRPAPEPDAEVEPVAEHIATGKQYVDVDWSTEETGYVYVDTGKSRYIVRANRVRRIKALP